LDGLFAVSAIVVIVVVAAAVKSKDVKFRALLLTIFFMP
jgi:ABC-type sugar transport system permease subunit